MKFNTAQNVCHFIIHRDLNVAVFSKHFTYNKYISSTPECMLSRITLCSRWEMNLQWSIAIRFINCILVGWLVGWLVVLKMKVDLAIFQPYLDLEAGDNQSLKIQVARPGIEPRSYCSASQFNHSATAAPLYCTLQCMIQQSIWLYITTWCNVYRY